MPQFSQHPAAGTILRAAFFFGPLALLLLWESLAPARSWTRSRLRRWTVNGVLGLLGMLTTALLAACLALKAAAFAGARDWGLLRQLDLPLAAKGVLGFLLLDLAVWAQHVATHRIPLLWRLHRVHHADADMDTGTALRFHPLEILASAFFKAGVVIVLGAGLRTVAAFEIALAFGSLFEHHNGRLPGSIDTALRWLLVTPAMHAVHHSTRPAETHSNYGFFIPWWDRLFRTYRRAGAPGMVLGLDEAPGEGLGAMLAWPFRRS
jgi:sterol desaturase/sphingolipid hydroxylase (fatty acid hydroxylase superfamily)